MAQGDQTGDAAQQAIRELLRRRGPGKTVCPSEAARLLAGEGGNWRAQMEPAHAAARALAARGEVRLTQGGETVAAPVGAYRIARIDKEADRS